MYANEFSGLLIDYDERKCHTIKIRTEDYGSENSFKIKRGSKTVCGSHQRYSDHANFEEECCMVPGTYTIDCECSYGDGWHGGYLEVDGTRYCEDFLSGITKSVTVSFN